MGYPAGKLDRLVTVLRRGPSTDDGYTKKPGEWGGIGTRWASVKPKLGQELVEVGGRQGLAVMSFWLRYEDLTSTMTEADALELDERRYEIIAPPMEVMRAEIIEVLAVAESLTE